MGFSIPGQKVSIQLTQLPSTSQEHVHKALGHPAMGMPPPHAVLGGETAQGCISELPRLLQNYTSPVNALLSHTLHRHRNAGMCLSVGLRDLLHLGSPIHSRIPRIMSLVSAQTMLGCL